MISQYQLVLGGNTLRSLAKPSENNCLQTTTTTTTTKTMKQQSVVAFLTCGDDILQLSDATANKSDSST